MAEEYVRINKYLSQCGVCSRRQADRMLDEGRVAINGVTADKGARVGEGDRVAVDGREVKREQEEILIAYHKPAGVVCTMSGKEKNNIIDAVGFSKRIYPVGRLDKDSTGLILLTNQGELMDRILRGRNYHEKEYDVVVDKPIRKEILDAMRQGVPILDTMTRPCQIKQMGEREFRIILTQGLNRQIRRMCEYFGYRVCRLKRIRIMNIELGDLREGSWRYLTTQELDRLKEMCFVCTERGDGHESIDY